MFVAAEIRLDVAFAAAQAGLSDLARRGGLKDASDEAYEEWRISVARVGPLGSAPGMSRLVEVRFRDAVVRGQTALMCLRWEASGPGFGLFPALDADLILIPDGESSTLLGVSGVYRPPLGKLGAVIDRAVLDRVATATVRRFLAGIGAAIAGPASVPPGELPRRPAGSGAACPGLLQECPAGTAIPATD